MSIVSLATYVQAISGGMPFWRLEITNWGNRGAGADANSVAYSGDIGSTQTVVIGPDSTADAAIVGYNDISIGTVAIAPQAIGELNQVELTTSINKPAVIMPGPITIGTTYSTQFGDTYLRDGSPTVRDFGTAEALFEAPRLQLLFYNGVPTVAPAMKRNDMYRTSQTAATADVGAETLIGIWPVMGRGCKSLYFQATGDLVATIRVGGISCFVTTQAGVAVPRTIEDTVNTAVVSINATTGVQSSVTTGRPMQWIAAYYTRGGGTGFINTNLIAQDC